MTKPRAAPPTRTAAPGAAGAPAGRRATTEPDRVLHLIGNSHIDPVWLWQWPEGYQEIRATFRSALDRMTEYPEFIFTCDSAAYYEWVEEIDPAMFEEIRRRVAEGRWELVGGWWVEPDCNLPSGESFVRHALISQRFFKDRFGRTATVGFNVDPSVVTCVANDYSYEDVFARQVEALAGPTDVVAGFSTGGTSPNVVRGLEVARERGATTILFAGHDGGPAGAHADVALIVPSTTTARIQEMHLLMLHLISEGVDAWAADA